MSSQVYNPLFISVGVPWLEQQIRGVMDEAQLTEEERYLIASLYTNLGCEDWVEVFSNMVRQAETPRVVVALKISARVLGTRQLKGERAEQWRRALLALERKWRKLGTSIGEVLQVKDKVIEVQRQRVRRLQSVARHKSG